MPYHVTHVMLCSFHILPAHASCGNTSRSCSAWVGFYFLLLLLLYELHVEGVCLFCTHLNTRGQQCHRMVWGCLSAPLSFSNMTYLKQLKQTKNKNRQIKHLKKYIQNLRICEIQFIFISLKLFFSYFLKTFLFNIFFFNFSVTSAQLQWLETATEVMRCSFSNSILKVSIDSMSNLFLD